MSKSYPPASLDSKAPLLTMAPPLFRIDLEDHFEGSFSMAKRTVTVPNISCNHCANTIKRELRELDGVTQVEVDPVTKQLSVEWNTPARWEDVRRVLEEINYPPQESS